MPHILAIAVVMALARKYHLLVCSGSTCKYIAKSYTRLLMVGKIIETFTNLLLYIIVELYEKQTKYGKILPNT